MSQKQFVGRSQQKHDVEANWDKATNFKPLRGEWIVYLPDENYAYARFKMGDGDTLLSALPFVLPKGEDGSKIHKVNSNPTSFTAGINGIATKCRFALSTVLSQSGSDVIRVDDLLLQNSILYFVCYVDDTYVYCDANVSIKGTDGYSPQRGTDYWTDTDKAEIKTYVDEAILGGAW